MFVIELKKSVDDVYQAKKKRTSEAMTMNKQTLEDDNCQVRENE
jgi:hypothetical protein